MAIDPLGVSIGNITTGLLSGGILGAGEIEFDAGRIYASNAAVIDPVSRTLVGNFQNPLLPTLPSLSLVKPDSSLGRVFFVSGNSDTGAPYRLLAFNLSTFLLTGSMPVEGVTPGGPPLGSLGVASLIRWGTDGVAFHSSAQVAFARTSSIQ